MPLYMAAIIANNPRHQDYLRRSLDEGHEEGNHGPRRGSIRNDVRLAGNTKRHTRGKEARRG